MEKLLYGREISEKEWSHEAHWLEQTSKRAAFRKHKDKWQCQRCGTTEEAFLIAGPCTCGTDCFYCSVCLNMGKLKKCTVLNHLPEANAFDLLKQPPLAWEGCLSAEQARASEDIVQSWEKKETRLVWAVAGAGKTEMIFQGIARCLMEGGRVCIASPRIDVCLELAPRLQSAFPTIALALLYGGMEEDYRYTPLVIATTHQLLRFREAFDLLIIDEIDSFPFHDDPALQFGAEKARKQEGALLYLTATPPRDMQDKVRTGDLQATVLPARYHRYPLPEITTIWLGDWRKSIHKRKSRSPLIRMIAVQLRNKRRCIVFLPHIALMQELEAWLQQVYPDLAVTSVSAEDPNRIEKVNGMRANRYDLLLSTTILERGVTFQDIDVIVVGAEDRVFTESSLVQIAGRVGRHKDFPRGSVLFGHFGKTKAIKGAIHQVRNMNRLAREGGLLHDLPDV